MHSSVTGFRYGRIIPYYYPVLNGKDINLTCYSAVSPQWSFNDGELPPHTIEGISLLMQNVTGDYSGEYECWGTLLNGTMFHNHSFVFVGRMCRVT